MELFHVSPWHKQAHPENENEFAVVVERIQANANLIQSAPFLLKTLLMVQQGDTSLVQEAIDRATGKIDWRGDQVVAEPAASTSNEDAHAQAVAAALAKLTPHERLLLALE